MTDAGAAAKRIRRTLVGLALTVCAGGAAVAQQPGSTRLEVAAGYDHLSNDFARWWDAELRIAHDFARHNGVAVAWRETERHDRRDREWQAEASGTWSTVWSGNATLAVSDTHRILPRYAARLEARRDLGSGFGMAGAVSRTGYTAADTVVAAVTAERYWGDWRAAYTLYRSHLFGVDSAFAHRLQFDRYYGDRDRIGVSLSAGEELENVPDHGVVITRVRGVRVHARHWFARDRAVVVDAGVERQGSLYTRTGLRLGFVHEF